MFQVVKRDGSSAEFEMKTMSDKSNSNIYNFDTTNKRDKLILHWLNNINGRLLKRKLVFTWCIKEKKSNQVIGRIDLGGFVKKQNAEISYHFAKKYWGYGLASEAVQKVTEFGMDELCLSRIQGLVMINNQASVRVLEKNGYIKEGVLHHYPFGREFHDVVMLANVR